MFSCTTVVYRDLPDNFSRLRDLELLQATKLSATLQLCPCYECAQAVSRLCSGRCGTCLLGYWEHGQLLQSPINDYLWALTSSSPSVSLLLRQASLAFAEQSK